MADWGLENRLARILKPHDGRTVMLAVDHGYFQGSIAGLDKPAEQLAPLVPYADTLMITRGLLRSSVPAGSDVPVMLRVSSGTSVSGGSDADLSAEGLAVSMEDAIRLNVSGVALSIFVGAPGERESLLNLSKLVDEGERYGIPVLAVTAVGKDMARGPRYFKLACRIAAELGAHLIKTYYCEGFETVVDTIPVPIVVAGGRKTGELEALQMAYDSMQAGAVGVDMGRNIFQADNPVGMIKAVRAIVHDGAKPPEAFEIYKADAKTGRAKTGGLKTGRAKTKK
jgi:putative autoinducer-2 (AI-2) aldolase